MVRKEIDTILCKLHDWLYLKFDPDFGRKFKINLAKIFNIFL
jgi:hypothetical protein